MVIPFDPVTGRNTYHHRITNQQVVEENKAKIRDAWFFPDSAEMPVNLDESVKDLRGKWQDGSVAVFKFFNKDDTRHSQHSNYHAHGYVCHARWGRNYVIGTAAVGILNHSNYKAKHRTGDNLTDDEIDRFFRHVIFETAFGMSVYWPEGWTFEDLMTKGIPVDGRWKAGFAQCMNVATRYPREYPAAVKLWNILVEAGIDPDFAFWFCASFVPGTYDYKSWSIQALDGISGHNLIKPLQQASVVDYMNQNPVGMVGNAEPWVTSKSIYGGSDIFIPHNQPFSLGWARMALRRNLLRKGYYMRGNPEEQYVNYSLDPEFKREVLFGENEDKLTTAEFIDMMKFEQRLFEQGFFNASIGTFVLELTKEKDKPEELGQNLIDIEYRFASNTYDIGLKDMVFYEDGWRSTYQTVGWYYLKGDLKRLASKVRRTLLARQVENVPPLPLAKDLKNTWIKYVFDLYRDNLWTVFNPVVQRNYYEPCKNRDNGPVYKANPEFLPPINKKGD